MKELVEQEKIMKNNTSNSIGTGTSKFFQHTLKIGKLYDYPELLPQCAAWGLSEWGYLHPKLNLEGCKDIYSKYMHKQTPPMAYVLFLNDDLIGMFLLLPHNENKKIAELWDVYIDKPYRNHGFGSYMMSGAKREAKMLGYKSIFIDTLKPRLNKFYEKFGATLIGESYLFGASCDKLAIPLEDTDIEETTYRVKGGAF